MPFSNLSELLHAIRARELQNMPRGANVFLSAGCAGRWYFDWINENYPGIKRHLGVEAYTPKPEDLPDDVIWLKDYIYNMKSVADNDIDLVFAGQTVEHLWPDEFAGFLCESHRVLKQDGLLVLDSPNQPIGKELGWYHPEHTMEFSVDEIIELVTLAGFEDINVKGIWLCFDREKNNFLPFEPNLNNINIDTDSRIINAKDNPQDSFIWWLEARKNSSLEPNKEKITNISQAIYKREYSRNLQRFFTQVGKIESQDAAPLIHSIDNQAGALRHGPYIPLLPGDYIARFAIFTPDNIENLHLNDDAIVLNLDVSATNVNNPLSEKVLRIKDLRKNTENAIDKSLSNQKKTDNFSEHELEFSIKEVAFGVEFRVITMGVIPVTVKAKVELIKLDNQVDSALVLENIPVLKKDKNINSDMLLSSACSQKMLESADFQAWVERMGHTVGMHRKFWEWAFISQALHERGLLKPGIRGLGFAVGQEPLPALFAKYGCSILATDLATEEANERGWVDTNQHATELKTLNKAQICPNDIFEKQVSFRFVDMNQLENDLRGFDFIWSSCSLEHLGSLEHGKQFIYNAMKCLKPGGFAIHTTEYNISSNNDTLENGPSVIYRKRDLEEIARRLRADGHAIEVDFTLGTKSFDLQVDFPPYKQNVHLRLELGGYTCTSYGLIIQKETNGKEIGKSIDI